MAILKNGINGPVSGKWGNNVAYELNGQLVVRSVGKYNVPEPSEKLRKVWATTAYVADFLRPVVGFIKSGFDLEVRGTTSNAYNKAVSFAKKAVVWEADEVTIDYSKVVFAKGTMPTVQHTEVEWLEEGLKFSWNIGVRKGQTAKADRVMLMAYFPEAMEAAFTICGARRGEGSDILPLSDFSEFTVAETYLAFVAENRSSISNSIYTGRYNRPTTKP